MGSYGNIFAVDTTGCSPLTASYDQLSYSGVPASEKMARMDLDNMKKYKGKILKVAEKRRIHPALIAAIISRETRAGTGLVNGWGDHGNAWGLMQVDKRWHTVVGGWDSVEHLLQALDILIYMIGEIKKKFPGWTREQQLKGGIAAYNAGPATVTSYDGVDSGTTGRDYSNDVVSRAKFFAKNSYKL